MTRKQFNKVASTLLRFKDTSIRQGWDTSRFNGVKGWRSDTLSGGGYAVRPFNSVGENRYNSEGVMYKQGNNQQVKKYPKQ